MTDPLYIDDEVAEEMGADSAHLDDAVNPFSPWTSLYWRWHLGRGHALAQEITIERDIERLHASRAVSRVRQSRQPRPLQ